MFYEYFALMLIVAVTGATGLTAWLTVSRPQRDRVRFTHHNKTVDALAKDPGLTRQNDASFRILDHPDATLWVSPSGLCLIWLRAPSKSPETEPQGALYQPTAVKGWLTCWVDPAHWRAPLKTTAAVAKVDLSVAPNRAAPPRRETEGVPRHTEC